MRLCPELSPLIVNLDCIKRARASHAFTRLEPFGPYRAAALTGGSRGCTCWSQSIM
jgi:hypothetical protein